jgi:hypothetical protein
MVVSCASAPTIGVAQSLFDRDVNVGVLDRPHPEYDPLGFPLGGFDVYPSLASSVLFDDNIYALSAKTADEIFVERPSLDIRSDWGRNYLRLQLGAEWDAYAAHPLQNVVDYNGLFVGRLDVDHASQVSLTLSAARMTQPRISENTIAGVLQPIQYDVMQGDLTAFRDFDRLRISGQFGFARYSFDNVTALNGSPIQEDFQDHDEYSGTLRAEYGLSPMTALFVEITPNDHVYRLEPPQVSIRRDSTGFDALAGANFQVTHLVTGEIGAGYQVQRYVDRRFDGVDGLALRGRLSWYATQLITVNLHADRTFQDSGSPNIAATKVTDAYLTADYELLRNLLITARLGYTQYRYPGADRRDDRYDTGLAATYTLNRLVGVTLGYAYVRELSVGMVSGPTFNDNRITLTLTFHR